ncbi:MAG: hypothetical protein NXY59_09285 [Aigarchaeota archaeon]|nr:hypothetical protein [Candidatus Pelearchaeum maunauluense]
MSIECVMQEHYSDYDLAQKLKKHKLTKSKIIYEIQQRTGIDIHVGTSKTWFKHKIQKPKKKLWIGPQTCYSLGVILGDGSIEIRKHFIFNSKRSKNINCIANYIIVLAVKDYELAKKAGENFAKTVCRSKPYIPYFIKSMNRWVVYVYSRLLFDLISKTVKPLNPRNLSKLVEHLSCMHDFIHPRIKRCRRLNQYRY